MKKVILPKCLLFVIVNGVSCVCLLRGTKMPGETFAFYKFFLFSSSMSETENSDDLYAVVTEHFCYVI